jgi:hypothetical protein
MTVAILATVALLGMALATRLLLADPERTLTPFVDRALNRLPSELQTRYADEWHADLAALSGRPVAAVVWALGLRRASIALADQAPRARRLPLTRASAPQVVLDAVSLAFAYHAGFSLRFGEGVPRAYDQLFERTLPIAVIGGLACLAVLGAYLPCARTTRVAGGVALATLIVTAYVALLQPVLISSARGLTALTVPAGVCLMFALSACLLMTVSRAGVAALRTRTGIAGRT